jgi:integrase
MAIQKRGESYRILFRHQGKQHTFPLGKVSEREARAKSDQVDYLLLRLKQKLLDVPAGVDIVEFLRFDGRPPDIAAVTPVTRALTLGELRDRFLAAREGGRETSTQKTSRIHFGHLVATLGERFPLPELSGAALRRHVARRAGAGISATTIRKEVTTLRTAWHWAELGEFPNRGLVYPKEVEPPPYQTREEVERQVAAGGLTVSQVEALWDALYLRPPELAELLEHVRAHARHPWIYPMACLAAHTGARRSELARILVADVDLAGGVVTIREKKRVKGKRSTRRAPLSPTAAAALKDWLGSHPGGPTLLCHVDPVPHSKKRSLTTGHQNGKGRATTLKGRQSTVRPREDVGPGPLTVGELHDHFKRTLAGSRWEVVRGLHTLRHSVASGLAAAGVDQRIIDDMLGHVSEEMRRRYRHLTPAAKAQAVAAVFG